MVCAAQSLNTLVDCPLRIEIAELLLLPRSDGRNAMFAIYEMLDPYAHHYPFPINGALHGGQPQSPSARLSGQTQRREKCGEEHREQHDRERGSAQVVDLPSLARSVGHLA